MTSHGLIFSAPMVRTLLAGSKTMTRRIVSARNGALPIMPRLPTMSVSCPSSHFFASLTHP